MSSYLQVSKKSAAILPAPPTPTPAPPTPTAAINPEPVKKRGVILIASTEDITEFGKLPRIPTNIKVKPILPQCTFCGRSFTVYPDKKPSGLGCCSAMCYGFLLQTPRHRRVETDEMEEVTQYSQTCQQQPQTEMEAVDPDE